MIVILSSHSIKVCAIAATAIAKPKITTLIVTSSLQIVEDAKAKDPGACLEAFGRLFSCSDAAAQLNGLSLLRHVASHTWSLLSADNQQAVVQHMNSILQSSNFAQMASPVRTQFAYALSDVTIAAGQDTIQQTVTQVLSELVQRGVPT